MTTDLELYDASSVPALPERLSLPEILETAKILAASGYFPTAKEVGQAAAKIMWGQDMGLTPMQAMTGIHVWIQGGTPTMQVSAKVITYLLRRHGFTWEFVQHDAEACEVEVYRHGKRQEPNVRFTKAQAAKAGLANKSVWQGYGEDMLWHRVAGRIADRFAPEIFDAVAIPVMTTEQAESTYPDPRDDLVKALHATYRERFPKHFDETPESYRTERLEWSAAILDRDSITTWNGPEAPETLTRADVQTLLDALESTASIEHPASEAQAGPLSPKAVAAPPAEHHTAEDLGEVAPADGTVPEGRAGVIPDSPPGAAPTKPAPTRARVRAPGKPNITQAQKKAAEVRRGEVTEQSLTPLQAMHPGFRKPLMEHFEGDVGEAEAEIGRHIAAWSEAGRWPGTDPKHAPWGIDLYQELASATFEKGQTNA